MVRTGEWVSEGWEIVKQDLWMHVLMMLIMSVLCSTVILAGPAMCGYFYVFMKKMRHPEQPIEVTDLFKGFDVFVPSLVGYLIIAVFTNVGMILCIVPGFIVWGVLIYAMPLMMDRQMDFWPAITASYERTKPDMLGFTLFGIVASLVSALGALACGIGMLVTAPICYAAIAVAYRDTFGLAPERPGDVKLQA